MYIRPGDRSKSQDVFSFFHYHFLLTYTLGHRKFVMTTPNSGHFAVRGPKPPFSGLKLGVFKYCVTVTAKIDVETPYLAENIFL